MEWDPGPPASLISLLAAAPLGAYRALPKRFRLEWGPIYYRGRLDGFAKVLVIGQDPSADEAIVRRAMVGTAGQRVQGFLRKLGITCSYLIVNASLFSIYGQFNAAMAAFMDKPEVQGWRNAFLDSVTGPQVTAVVAFGRAAHKVVDDWPGALPLAAAGSVFKVQHPTARTPSTLLRSWNAALPNVATLVTPDAGGVVDLTPYDLAGFREADLARIPPGDLPFATPEWVGTGDMATRLRKGQAAIDPPPQRSAIVWTALGDQG